MQAFADKREIENWLYNLFYIFDELKKVSITEIKKNNIKSRYS